MLKSALLKQFKGYENDFEILRQIMDRKQMSHESFDEFYKSITQLKSQLKKPIEDQDLVRIVSNNISTRLMNFIYPMQIKSIEQFRDECRRTEKMLQSRYNTQSRFNNARTVNEVSHSFDESTIDIPSEPFHNISATQSNYRPNSSISRENLSSNTICFNCKKSGHIFVNCRLPVRNLFCYRCGTDNCTVLDCPKCNTLKENLKSNEISSGKSRSTQTSPE